MGHQPLWGAALFRHSCANTTFDHASRGIKAAPRGAAELDTWGVLLSSELLWGGLISGVQPSPASEHDSRRGAPARPDQRPPGTNLDNLETLSKHVSKSFPNLVNFVSGFISCVFTKFTKFVNTWPAWPSQPGSARLGWMAWPGLAWLTCLAWLTLNPKTFQKVRVVGDFRFNILKDDGFSSHCAERITNISLFIAFFTVRHHVRLDPHLQGNLLNENPSVATPGTNKHFQSF